MTGYFGIGIFKPRHEENTGTLFRSAYQLGASFIFLIGSTYKPESSDVFRTSRHIPLFTFGSYTEFRTALFDCVPVAIEFGAKSVPLGKFRHPERCAYILGNEIAGLSGEILKGAKQIVSIESVREASYNVAMAGTIVMYHRMMQGTDTLTA